MKIIFLAGLALSLALAHVSQPVRAEDFESEPYAFSIEYPKGWKIAKPEGELVTRAVGPGSAMNVSVAAASRPDFDAERFSGAELERIAAELAAATAGALRDFALIESGRTELGGKPAAFFRYRAMVDLPKGPVETVGHYVATAHRGRVYSVTAVTQKKLEKRMQPLIIESIRSFRFTDSRPAEQAE